MDSRKGIDCTPEIQAWRDRNPIRVWVDAKPKLKRARLAQLQEQLSCSRYALYRWMHGVNLPETIRFASLLTIIRTSSTAYMRWWNEMPHEETPCEVQPHASASTRRRS